jgi:hypothetical protein
MGAMSTFSPSQSRQQETIRGIGFGDKIAEQVVGVTDYTGSCERAMLYLCNLWQATGYAAGVDGAVRSIAHHRWPFDIEQQIVFSSLADFDLDGANVGYNNGQGGTPGQFDGGIKVATFPQVTNDGKSRPGANRGHSAIVTLYEACWFTSYEVTFSKDSAAIMESGQLVMTDVHDFASAYGEFIASGNDPTVGQKGSIRYANQALASLGQGAGNFGSAALSALGAINT